MRKQNACLGEVILGPKVMNLYVCLQGAISIVLAKEEPIGAFGMLTKWFLTTRLATRTKESNMYASIWVENPRAK